MRSKDDRPPKNGPKKPPANRMAFGLFRLVTRFVSALSEADCAALLSGDADLAVIPKTSLSSDGVNQRLLFDERPPLDIEKLRASLSKAPSTSDALNVLLDANLSRRGLEEFLRLLDVPSSKNDSNKRLAEKIIEALVGSRLTSKAISGR